MAKKASTKKTKAAAPVEEALPIEEVNAPVVEEMVEKPAQEEEVAEIVEEAPVAEPVINEPEPVKEPEPKKVEEPVKKEVKKTNKLGSLFGFTWNGTSVDSF